MLTNIIPTQYILEIYHNSFGKDNLIYSCESLTPFASLSVGNYVDYINISGDHWQPAEIEHNEKLIVKAIEHLFYPVNDTHDVQKTMLLVKKEVYRP